MPYTLRLRGYALLSLALLVPLQAGGCGGGGGSGGKKTLVLPAVFDRTGSVTNAGIVYPAAGYNGHNVGDLDDNTVMRGFVAIQLAGVPAGAQVESASLRLVSNATWYGNPFGELGPLTLDHVDVGAGLSVGDFAGGTLTVAYAVIPLFAAGQTVTIEVGDALRADLAAARPTSTYRIQFTGAPSLDAGADVVAFDCVVADAALQPSILLTYH